MSGRGLLFFLLADAFLLVPTHVSRDISQGVGVCRVFFFFDCLRMCLSCSVHERDLCVEYAFTFEHVLCDVVLEVMRATLCE